jgi:hypothetical protein
MNTRTIKIVLCCLVFQPVLYAEELATLKKQLAAEVDTLNSTASANFVTACINVTREVQQKRIRLYAISSSAKTGTFKEGDFTIQVIYNEELADMDTKVAGAYYQHNNHLILSFAACRFASGDKAFGLRLVRMIAAAHPSLTWSSPKQPPTPIQKILAGLEKDDDSVRQFLDDEKRDWPSYVKMYGP